VTANPPTLARAHRPVSQRVASRLAAIFGAALVVLAGILAVNGGSIYFRSPSAQQNPVIVLVTGIDRTIVYRGSWTGYFGPSTNDSCLFCPIGGQAGSAVRLPLATWSPPENLSLWIYTNVTGPFPVQAAGCSPAPCTLPWLGVWYEETFVPARSVASLTLFGTFLLTGGSQSGPNTIDLNVTVCPVPVCSPPST
jgi:hypothetical protein